MEQMNVSEEKKVQINFEDPAIPQLARVFEPLVYKDVGNFFAVLGPSLETGITGSGISAEIAINNWVTALNERIIQCKLDDATAQYVRDILNSRKDEVW